LIVSGAKIDEAIKYLEKEALKHKGPTKVYIDTAILFAKAYKSGTRNGYEELSDWIKEQLKEASKTQGEEQRVATMSVMGMATGIDSLSPGLNLDDLLNTCATFIEVETHFMADFALSVTNGITNGDVSAIEKFLDNTVAPRDMLSILKAALVSIEKAKIYGGGGGGGGAPPG
jgi:hypothetical protein